ncbi:MAG: LacI family DNA-binding transcriptional regulator [Candidatus Omnitrophica bacterium]|nr:LacI family DNA-binding transcriptional regulator [Candidatus Omnitrophota bacterium]
MNHDKKRTPRRKMQDTTLREISEITGFACSTVSAVLNDDSKCYASVKTKEKILKAAGELNYHPNLLYRGLRAKKTNTIGLIVPNLHVNVSIASIELIEDLAWKAGYHLFLGYSKNDVDKEEVLLKDFISRRVDGIILVVGVERRCRPELQYLLEQDFPLVTIGKLAHFDCSFVTTDYYWGGQLAARHLNDAGHKKVLLFDEFPPPSASLRMNGFRDTAKKYNMKIDEVFLVNGKMEKKMAVFSEEYLITESVSIFKKLLKSKGPTGVFAANDAMALGVLKAAREMGIGVPDELSVIGFDDTPIAAFASVPITTIRQKKEEMSRKVVKLLMDKIEGEEEILQEYILPELVVRSSTGSAKEGR